MLCMARLEKWKVHVNFNSIYKGFFICIMSLRYSVSRIKPVFSVGFHVHNCPLKYFYFVFLMNWPVGLSSQRVCLFYRLENEKNGKFLREHIKFFFWNFCKGIHSKLGHFSQWFLKSTFPLKTEFFCLSKSDFSDFSCLKNIYIYFLRDPLFKQKSNSKDQCGFNNKGTLHLKFTYL